MEILKQYLPLCWFTNNPLELPRSISFFRKNILFYVLIELFIQINITDPIEAIAEVGIETTLTLTFVAVILLFKKALAGYIPAATSFLICENVFAAFCLPIVIWLTTTDDLLSYILFFGLILWDIAMITYLIRRILSCHLVSAFLLSILYFICTYGGAFTIMMII